MGKAKKEKLIQKSGDFSENKVKEYVERENNKNNIVSRGKDITFNNKH